MTKTNDTLTDEDIARFILQWFNIYKDDSHIRSATELFHRLKGIITDAHVEIIKREMKSNTIFCKKIVKAVKGE